MPQFVMLSQHGMLTFIIYYFYKPILYSLDSEIKIINQSRINPKNYFKLNDWNRTGRS